MLINELKKDVKDSSFVYLATDPDREGEAIAWHLAEVLHLPVDQTKRLEFHEITRPAIQNAIEHPRTINMDLVESQECRRILDRIMGFKLTGLLKKKIKMESAGRVQSAALKLIVDHEKEIEAFVPEEYWTIQGSLSVIKKELPIKLDKIDGKQPQIHNEQEAQSILDELPSAFKVDSVIKKAKKKEPKAPFITSTLQQEAFNRYKFSTKKTASIAQKLYEGKTIGDEITGLITYMRTDSARLSLQFVESAEKYILENYGEAYLGKVHIAKQKGQVQDAHEAIRPTSLKRTPEMMKEYLSRDEYQLYKMIYYRTLASLMKASEYEVTTILMNVKNYVFKAEGETLVFDGYEKIYRSAEDEEKPRFSPLKKGQSIETITLEEAMDLFKLPRILGEHEGKTVTVNAGRFGPYIYYGGTYTSLPKGVDPMEIELEEALELIKEKAEAEAKKHLKKFDEEPELEIMNGRYGPYIAYKGSNYKIPKDIVPEDLNLDACMEIIKLQSEKAASAPAKPKRGKYTKKKA